MKLYIWGIREYDDYISLSASDNDSLFVTLAENENQAKEIILSAATSPYTRVHILDSFKYPPVILESPAPLIIYPNCY